ncbi:MAG: hypothetical protein DJ555_04360 [Desulfurococcaceae archaeon]|nr:MAG: hypothetical protein DJ555_04360 [Desulfurococcaceae archaeon]
MVIAVDDSPLVVIRNSLERMRSSEGPRLDLIGGDILRFLRSTPNGCAFADEIIKALGVSRDAVYYMLNKLSKAGLVRKHLVKPKDSYKKKKLYCFYDSPYYPPEEE